jgi:DNA invertase Pin-like site-specific DNA recombinase
VTIIARTSEGRKRAKGRGVRSGRPRKLMPHQRREAIARRDGGGETLTDIARNYNVSHSFLGVKNSRAGLGARSSRQASLRRSSQRHIDEHGKK